VLRFKLSVRGGGSFRRAFDPIQGRLDPFERVFCLFPSHIRIGYPKTPDLQSLARRFSCGFDRMAANADGLMGGRA